MGIDLKIYPVFEDNTWTHEVLCFDREGALFDQILKLDSNKLINKVRFEDTKLISDCYGQRLRYIDVEDLKVLVSVLPKNKAVLRYLKSLKGHFFLLYWH